MRCNINKKDYSLYDCIINFEIKPDPEFEKFEKYRESLFQKGYVLNEKDTSKKCEGFDGLCEYVCVYPKNGEYYDLTQEPIKCELLKF